jgi:hypothetical protein
MVESYYLSERQDKEQMPYLEKYWLRTSQIK